MGAEGDAWTWRKGASEARYDRVYTHDAGASAVRCLHTTRLPHVWGDLTGHVALHVVIERVSLAEAGGAAC